jgi:hypothetical protein
MAKNLRKIFAKIMNLMLILEPKSRPVCLVLVAAMVDRVRQQAEPMVHFALMQMNICKSFLHSLGKIGDLFGLFFPIPFIDWHNINEFLPVILQLKAFPLMGLAFSYPLMAT